MAASRIPLEVIFEILVWLPAKFVLRFKCVCKEWYNLINSPTFIKLHLNKSLQLNSQHNCILLWITSSALCGVDDLHQPVKATKLNWPKDTIEDGDDLNFVGSCNGLVCFKITWSREYLNNGRVRSFLICNPTTRTFKSILPSSEKNWMDRSLSYGFGYDSVHDDYKIVVTSYCLGETNKYVCTYSLKTDLWSCSSTTARLPTGREWAITSRAIYGNNMLHYLVYSVIEGATVTIDYRIVRFDVVSEKWRDNLSIPVQVSGLKNFVRLRKLDGWLYLHVGGLSGRSTDSVWMMEEDGSWKKMFHLPEDLYMHYLVARSKDGRRHLLLRYFNNDKTELVWYDQQHNTRRSFKLAETIMPRDRLSYMPCIASLVAIPGCSLTKLQQVEDGA